MIIIFNALSLICLFNGFYFRYRLVRGGEDRQHVYKLNWNPTREVNGNCCLQLFKTLSFTIWIRHQISIALLLLKLWQIYWIRAVVELRVISFIIYYNIIIFYLLLCYYWVEYIIWRGRLIVFEEYRHSEWKTEWGGTFPHTGWKQKISRKKF